METQQASASADPEQLQEIFRTLYARFLSQGMEPNDAVARALLEMQQQPTATNKPTGNGEAATADIKMEDASRQQQEDVEMEALKEAAPVASASAVASDLAAATITETIPTDAAATTVKTAATVKSHQIVSTTNNTLTTVSPMGAQLENALKLATETDDYRVVKRLVYQVFSDPDALSAAFIKGDVSQHEEAKTQWWGIDRDQMERVFSLLQVAMGGSDQEAMQNTFRNALEMLVTQPWNVCSTWHAPRQLRFFLVLFEHPSMFDPDYLNVVGGLCRLFFYLPGDAKALVRAQWMAFFSADELHRLVDILQQAITVCLYGSRKMDLVYAACGVLAELHVVNRERLDGLEPFATYDEFYNDAVNSEVDIVQDYSRSIIFWKKRRVAIRAARRADREELRRRRQLNEEVSEVDREREEQEQEQEDTEQESEHMPERQLSEMSFCDFPFVLDAASKSKVLQIDSDLEQRVHGGQQHFQSPIPPPYAYSNEPGPIGPMTNLADQPLDFAPRFSHDHGLRMHSGFPRNDSARSTRGNDSGVPMPSLNSWSSISPGMIYPPIPPVLASGAQLDPPVAVPSSVPGHTPSPFGRFAGSGITPAIPAAAAPFPGSALPATVLSGDAYGMSTMSERPKKASVPNWLREEIKKAVITSSSADHPKEDAELMEDQGVDKSYAKGDQADSKSIDSSRSTEEEDDEDVVEGARTAATNQEIKRVLTEVLLKVTDELFDEIATKVLDEDDLAVEAKLNVVTSNQNVSSSPFPVSTPKASAKVLLPVKVQEPDNDDTSEKSSSSSPGDVLGLGNYASDDEKNDDRDGEIQSSNMQGSKTMFNVELSSTKRNLRDIQDAVGNASTPGNVIEHSGNHVISDINDGSTSSVNEMSKNTGFSKLNDDWMDREMGQEHSLKPSSKGKDNETKFGDGIASGTRDVLGMVSEQQGKNVNGKNASKDPHDGETKTKPLDSGKQESMRGSSLKDRVKEEGEVKTRTNEKADENRLKQDARRPRKEDADDQTIQKGKLKDQDVKSGEKGKDSDSRHRSTHHNSKDERREDKHLRASTKDGTDRNRVYTKDDEGRTRQKISSELTRHKSSRDRNKDKAVDHSTNSSDDSDDSKRKVKSRKRDKSPSPIRSRRSFTLHEAEHLCYKLLQV